MKTDDLISLLAEDHKSGPSLGQILWGALAAGVIVSALVLLLTVGIRQNMEAFLPTARVLFKIGYTIVLSAAAVFIVFAVGRPGVPLKGRLLALVPPLLLVAGGAALEMQATPESSWATRAIGEHPLFCIAFIPVLAIAPLGAFLYALKQGAPENPARAGMLAGLAAGAIAAAVYAWHCPDDSPFFVAIWYTIGMGIVALVGTLIGARVLRW